MEHKRDVADLSESVTGLKIYIDSYTIEKGFRLRVKNFGICSTIMYGTRHD